MSRRDHAEHCPCGLEDLNELLDREPVSPIETMLEVFVETGEGPEPDGAELLDSLLTDPLAEG